VKALQDDAARHTKELNDEQNRRAGEVVGGLSVNTAVIRELIAELKAARREGHLPSAVPPKAAELKPPGGP
jgi:hypothetical protein